jgi:hypothetical protein
MFKTGKNSYLPPILVSRTARLRRPDGIIDPFMKSVYFGYRVVFYVLQSSLIISFNTTGRLCVNGN